MRSSLLKYSADRRTLAFIATYYVALTVFWWTDTQNFAAVAFLAALAWIAAVIAHNTLHVALFKDRILNRIFQVVLTMTYGFPVSEYTPGHNLSHHRYTQERRDVMRTTKVRFQWNLLNAIFFVPFVAIDVTRANYRFVAQMKHRMSAWYRQLIIEAVFCWGSKAILLAIDPGKAFWLVVVPHLFALWGITFVNFLQHDGCDPNHAVNHSRNFVNQAFNWFTFNNGFHAIHHMHPAMHWSLLPEAHAREVAPFNHPALNQESMPAYLFKTFILPGRRVDFLGKPFLVEGEGPDHDWIATVSGVEEAGAYH